MRELFNLQCGFCKSKRIAYDESKGELFCLNCGFIFAENFKIFSIVEYEQSVKEIEAEERRHLMSEC